MTSPVVATVSESPRRRTATVCDESDGKIEDTAKRRRLSNLPSSKSTDLISLEELSDCKFFFENGLRKVRPYYYTFNVFVKKRWFGRTIIDVMTTEFRTDNFYNHRQSMENGSLTVNKRNVAAEYVLKNGDLVQNRVHRHECAVAADPIRIVGETDDLIAIDKPASIPAHPCGRYRYNSVTYILAKEKGHLNLRILNRLDRLTSGLMILSKTHDHAEKLAALMAERVLKKTYVCRVSGYFPWEKIECAMGVALYSKLHQVYQASSESDAKPSLTIFERIFGDEYSSVVKCYPKTGRTHQIRVHLQYLGYPILNDPVYNSTAWGPTKGKAGYYGDRAKEKVLDSLSEIFTMRRWLAEDGDVGGSNDASAVPAANSTFESTTVEEATAATTSPFFDADCGYCRSKFRDPSGEELFIYLHALRYEFESSNEGQGFAYETEMPNWAKADWKKPVIGLT